MANEAFFWLMRRPSRAGGAVTVKATVRVLIGDAEPVLMTDIEVVIPYDPGQTMGGFMEACRVAALANAEAIKGPLAQKRFEPYEEPPPEIPES